MSRYARRSYGLLGLSVAAAMMSLAGASMVRSIPMAPAKAAIEPASTKPAEDDLAVLAARRLLIPVKGVAASALADNFAEGRGKRKHEAIDILAPRGTPVVAVDDGRVAKLFRSQAGGLTVYQFDRDERFIYYYAHLDRYADGLKEGVVLRRGDVVGEVGTSGNAPSNTPHLHFTIFRVGPEKKWWKGTPVNPYPLLAGGARTAG